MGHGASTNVKKLTINQTSHGLPRKSSGEAAAADSERGAPSPAKLGWTRSSSDGCIVENLNTSKTKVEFLEQQVEEFKELFHHADTTSEEAHSRAITLEQQMAEVEGTNFELLDRVSELEQQVEESKDQTSPEAEREFAQMLLEKDQIVEKQEQQIKSLEEDCSKMRIKLKRKLRAAQTELAEAKQEAGLKVYSLKDQLTMLREENAKLTERLDRAHQVSSARSRQCGAVSATPDDYIAKETPTEVIPTEAADGDWEDGRTKVILVLSSRLSAQEQRISDLEEVVQEREQTIQGLRQQLKANPRPPSGSQKHSAEKRPELLNGASSKKRTAPSEDDRSHQASVGRQRNSSSSRKRDGHRSSSSGRQETPPEQRPADSPSNNSVANPEIRNTSSARSRKLRQQPPNGVDSVISDHSFSSNTKASSAGSSRERRRVRNQQFRQSSADESISRSRIMSQSETYLHGRDSEIGITSDAKSNDNDDLHLQQMMDDITGNS